MNHIKQKIKRKTYKKRHIQEGGEIEDIITPISTPINKIQNEPYIEEKLWTLSDMGNEDLDNIRFVKCLRKSLDKTPTCEFDSEKMIKEMSSKEISDIIFENMDKRLRSVIEPLTASKQCHKTIGLCSNSCTCWICGTIIQTSNKNDVTVKQYKPEKYAEQHSIIHCDHVLPIVRAILLSAIKSTNKIENREQFKDNSKQLRDYMEKSYRYAHGSCNILKSDIILVKWNNATNTIVYDEEEGLNLANMISKNVAGTNPMKLVEMYRREINILLEPINKEIQTILKIKGANMNTFWTYTMEIMKSYSCEQALMENAKLTGKKLERALANMHKMTAVKNLAEYKKRRYEDMKSVKINLDKVFRKEKTIRKNQQQQSIQQKTKRKRDSFFLSQDDKNILSPERKIMKINTPHEEYIFTPQLN